MTINSTRPIAPGRIADALKEVACKALSAGSPVSLPQIADGLAAHFNFTSRDELLLAFLAAIVTQEAGRLYSDFDVAHVGNETVLVAR